MVDFTSEQEVVSSGVATGITNPLVVTAETSGLTSSFAGGNLFSVTAEGLTTDIKNNRAQIQVCEKECKLSEDSTDAEAKCELPFIQTIGSRNTFTLVEAASIVGPTILESADFGEKFFDGKNLPGISGSSSNCYIGTSFTEGFIGYVTEFRFFMDYISNRDKQVGFLKF